MAQTFLDIVKIINLDTIQFAGNCKVLKPNKYIADQDIVPFTSSWVPNMCVVKSFGLSPAVWAVPQMVVTVRVCMGTDCTPFCSSSYFLLLGCFEGVHVLIKSGQTPHVSPYLQKCPPAQSSEK
jgi:hypothetical protein